MDFAQIRNQDMGKFIASRKNISDIAEFKNRKGNFEFYVFENPGATTKIVKKKNIKEYDLLGRGYKQSARYEFEPLEMEKYLVENAKRNFRSKNINAPKFEQYTEPGGKDYTELVFSLKKGGMDVGIPIETAKLKRSVDKSRNLIWKEYPPKERAVMPFKSAAHMNVKNEIAHVRFKTRDLNGKKVLTVEEMQSDIANRYASGDFNLDVGAATGAQYGIKDFPFKQNWYEMVTKRLIRYAADNGFDAVAIPKGSVAAERYGQKIGEAISVQVQPRLGPASTDPRFFVKYFGGGNRIIKEKTFYPEELKKLEKEIGFKNYSSLKKNIDNFIENTPESDLRNTYYFSEFDKPIIIGSGKGKAELYDKAIPSFMKKYGKKWNAKVYDDRIGIDFKTMGSYLGNISKEQAKGMPVTILEITPEMKKAVQEGSQSLFEILGIATSGAVASKAVSDNIENNIISQSTK